MILFIICCVLCVLIFLGMLFFIIACRDDKEYILGIVILAVLLASIPAIGIVKGVMANSDIWQEPKYQELAIEHDTLCEAIDNGGLADIGITSKVIDYNKDVAYYKAKRNNKWVGYYVDKAYERVEVIDYKDKEE